MSKLYSRILGWAVWAVVIAVGVGLRCGGQVRPPPAPAVRGPAQLPLAGRAAVVTGRVGVSRVRLVPGDADRGWTAVWSRMAALGGPPLGGPSTLTLTGGGDVVPVPFEPFPAAEPSAFFQQTVRVPSGTAPGPYDLAVNGVAAGTVEVRPPNERPKLVRLLPGATAQTLEAALERFDVELLPGVYYLGRAVRLPANRRLTGYGAHLFRNPDGDYGERMFVNGEDCTLTGLTLHPWYLALHGEYAVPGMVLRDCTLASGILGYGYADILVTGCDFAGGYAIYAPPGAYLGNRFTGGTPSSALLFYGSYPGNTCVVDCTFDKTRDALVVNTNAGSFTDNFIQNLHAYGLNNNQNGNEVCSAEGNPANECSRNLYVGVWVIGCCSPIGVAETTVRDNLWWTIDADGPSCLLIDGWGGVEVSGNTYANYELRGGRVVIGARAQDGNGAQTGELVSGRVTRNVFLGRHTGQLIPSRLNQPTGTATAYGVKSAVVAFSAVEGAANDISDVAGPDGTVPTIEVVGKREDRQ